MQKRIITPKINLGLIFGIILIMAIPILSPVEAATKIQIMRNRDFENWTSPNNLNDWGEFNIVWRSTTTYSGTYAVGLTGAANPATHGVIAQAYSGKPTETYTLSFWYRNAHNPDDLYWPSLRVQVWTSPTTFIDRWIVGEYTTYTYFVMFYSNIRPTELSFWGFGGHTYDVYYYIDYASFHYWTDREP